MSGFPGNVGWSGVCETSEEIRDEIKQCRPQRSLNKPGRCENKYNVINMTKIHQIDTFLFKKKNIVW